MWQIFKTCLQEVNINIFWVILHILGVNWSIAKVKQKENKAIKSMVLLFFLFGKIIRNVTKTAVQIKANYD